MVQPCLKTRIGLAHVMQKARALQIHDTLDRKTGGFREAFGLLFDITAVLLKRQGKAGDGTARVVLGRVGAAVCPRRFFLPVVLDPERRHEDDATRTVIIRSIKIEIGGNALPSVGVIEQGEIFPNVFREMETGESRPQIPPTFRGGARQRLVGYGFIKQTRRQREPRTGARRKARRPFVQHPWRVPCTRGSSRTHPRHHGARER
ncbi:MAG: hypothetical protein FD149_334 [Rhodospirillaceae bacterium]|nr:MAG: hypothetical protein FD149_334 [Rhodospirillaceae bacterium]